MNSKIISQFPLLKKKKIIYFDNAATTQKPQKVIDAIVKFYTETNANINRGMYNLGEEATKQYEQARTEVAKFINCFEKEIIFTRNTTESLNLLSYSLESLIPKEKDEIVLTEMEHHANLVPWQQLAKRKNMKLKFIKLKEDFSLDYEDAKQKITEKAAIVSLTWKSNVLGTINEVEKIISLSKKVNALFIIDAAQSITTEVIDVKKLDADFISFSGHKMFGPTGIGVLYGKEKLLMKMSPFMYGGNMVSRVTLENAEWNDLPMKFEAGTPNISGAIGLAEAIKFIKEIGIKNIKSYEKELTEYALKKLSEIKEITAYGKKQEGIISFNIQNSHPHDLACLLNEKNICIRVGYHCAMPLVKKLDERGVCRISFSIYNTKKEIDLFVSELKKAIKILKHEK